VVVPSVTATSSEPASGPKWQSLLIRAWRSRYCRILPRPCPVAALPSMSSVGWIERVDNRSEIREFLASPRGLISPPLAGGASVAVPVRPVGLLDDGAGVAPITGILL
jgi:hypothetical protein